MQRIFFCTSWDDLHVALQCFKHPQAVYLRFSHIANFQPKFYVGSTSSFVLDREHSRYRKFPASATEQIRLGRSGLTVLVQI